MLSRNRLHSEILKILNEVMVNTGGGFVVLPPKDRSWLAAEIARGLQVPVAEHIQREVETALDAATAMARAQTWDEAAGLIRAYHPECVDPDCDLCDARDRNPYRGEVDHGRQSAVPGAAVPADAAADVDGVRPARDHPVGGYRRGGYVSSSRQVVDLERPPAGPAPGAGVDHG